MPLTQAQVEQFRADGFIFVPGFFAASEVRAMQAETARFQREGLLRNVATDGDSKTLSAQARNLQIIPIFSKSSLFRALPFDGKVVDAVTQLIGAPFLLQIDQMFLKPARDGAGTNWHQDNAYFKIADPFRGTAMWIAVHDATLENGTMHLLPQMYHQTLPHSPDPMSDHHIRCYPDETNERPAILAAGGVVFFCYGTPHCTKANRTAADRAGAAFHFLRVDDVETELPWDRRHARPFITGPSASGGLREYGEVVAGTWPIEVGKTLAAG